MADYITTQEFLDYFRSNANAAAQTDLVKDAITASSRAVDSYCGRRFYTAWEVQYFRVDPRRDDFLWVLPMEDMELADLDDQDGGAGTFEVATETSNDGSYPNLWTPNVDFIAEPVNQSENGISGWPYTHLRAIGGKVWPLNMIAWQRPTVRVTGNFGWSAVPVPVIQATKILTAQFVKLAEAPLGVAGFGEYGAMRVRDIPQVCSLLRPYRKPDVIGIA